MLMLFTHNRKCSPSLPTFLLLLLLGVRLGRKQVGSLCLCWRTAALGFSRRKRVSPMAKSVHTPVVKNQRCWMVALVKTLCARLRGFLFHFNITWNTTHIKVLSRIFTCFWKSVQQIGIVKSRASECIWCEWWPVDSDKLNEFVLASSRRVTKPAGGRRCVSAAHENQWKVWKCAAMRKYFSRWN